jgi:diguanylate cyclase (GGDEF)-like protein
MDDKLCLCICENFKKEILSILEQEMLKDLDVFFYTARCHGAKTENEDLKQLLLSLSKNVQYSRIEVLNSDLCLQRTSCRYPDHKIYFRTEDLCFKFLANSRLIEQLIDEASYITTPSLLEKWEDIILGKWQFDRTNAISFFHESTKKIVFLDTMTKKDAITALKALSDYIKIPYEVLSIGTDHLKLKTLQIYNDWLNWKEKKQYQQKLAKAAASLADFEMSFEFLKNIAQSFSENEIIENMFALFAVLFQPANMCFLRIRHRVCDHGHFKNYRGTASSLDKEKSFKEMRQFYKRNKNEAACSHSLTEDKKGFLLKIKHKEIILGILMTKEPLMQEYLQKYLSHALSLSAMLGLAISNARSYEELAKIKDKYRFLSFHDSLTGLYNRMYFDEEIKRINNDLDRFRPVTIISADINNLKEVNDHMGHAAGDRLIRNTAKILSSSLRKTDILSRIGGDEFCAILPKTSLSVAAERIEKIKVVTEEYNRKDKDIHISLAIGSSGTEKSGKDDLYDILKKSDELMYINKKIMKAKVRSQKTQRPT